MVSRPPYAFLLPPQAPDEIGRLGGYRVLRKMSEGGMAFVFEAEDLELGRKVALKVLKPTISDECERKRFFQEARVAAGLHHENIVTIYQFAHDKDVPFLAMEILEGEALDAKLARERWLPVAEALAIARQVAQGLVVAHEAGLIHRDIKPANIWLESGRGQGHVKILDFGLVKPLQADPHLTARGVILGTPSYMAPEMLACEAVDARTDLYSLGCVMYRMLTGKAPFEDPNHNTRAVLAAVIVHNIQPLDELEKQIPRPVAALMLQMLAKNPNDRPANARAVIERLEALERGDSTIPALGALIATPGPRTASTAPGIPWGMWAGAVVVAAAVVIGAVIGFHRYFGAGSEDHEPRRTHVK
jgi:urea transport system substrate-binding protein